MNLVCLLPSTQHNPHPPPSQILIICFASAPAHAWPTHLGSPVPCQGWSGQGVTLTINHAARPTAYAPLWTQMKGHSAPHEFGYLEQPPKRLGDTTWKYRDSNYPRANPDQWETAEGRHRKTNSSSPSPFTSFHRSPTQWDTTAW